MSRRFPGLLKNSSEPASGLRVTLVLSSDVLDIESNDITLGRWKCSQIEAGRSSGNWFYVRIDDEDWEFLPDSPTEFLFYAIPRMGLAQPRRRSWMPHVEVNVSDLVYVARVALGAVLAVVLLSIGMLMGRNRWDDSSLTVLAVLMTGAALGAWWTTKQHRDRHTIDGPRRDRAPVLPRDQKRSALSVREVISMAQQDATEEPAILEMDSHIPETRRPDGGDSGVGGAPDRLVDSSRPDTTDILDELEPDRADGHVDVAFENLVPQLADSPTFDHEPLEAEPDGESTDPLDRSIEVGADAEARAEEDVGTRDDVEAISDEPQTPDDERFDSGPGKDQSLIPAASSATSVHPGDGPELGSGDEATEHPLASRRRASMSAADLLAETADLGAPIKPIGEPSDRDTRASPIELTAVRGIGPAISAALNQLGITDVHDLAVLESDDLIYLERRLGRFASRSRALRWVTEAQRLVSSQSTTT